MSSLIRFSAATVRLGASLALSAVLAACSGGGAPTVENPVTTAPDVQAYSGPPAQNADVQAFRINLWDNIKANNRCGGCHNANGQSPTFARNDDINAAYTAANTVVNLTQPDQSRMVIKVAGGHNCWLASASACGDTLTVWIRNWAGSAATGGRQIVLQEPPIREVGSAKTFPAAASDNGAASFANTIYPVLRANCRNCHTPTGGQSPYFASTDVNEAYGAARSKINLDLPAQSRFVVRLRDEFHNCWAPPNPPPGSTNCSASAGVMQAAIEQFTNGITPTEVDPNLVTSKALGLYDGTVAAGGNRFDSNIIALYEFKTGTGDIAYDTSGVEPAANLTLSSTDMWVGGWGINVKAGQKAQAFSGPSKKIADQIRASGEFTIEAWVAPANVAQEDAYIVSYSSGITARNFTLAQRMYQYEALTRTSETGANGMPSLLTDADDRDAQASLQHVVLTYDPVNGRRLYVNGSFTGDEDPRGGGGSIADWDDTFALVLGNETSSNRQWLGVMRLVAIHNRALTLPQIQQNFAAGVGERYFLLFSVSHLVDIPRAYIMLEASEYDSYAYLFTKPTFISLDPAANVSNIEISGIRIGINGAEAKVGQSYIPLAANVGGANYSSATGQLMSPAGAVIASEKGVVDDRFFLTFERIGTRSHTPTEPPVFAAPPQNLDPSPQAGIRTFDELAATYEKVTGVRTTTQSVAATFASVKQQLPSVESIDSFLASHQTGIAQLAIAYCSAMVDNATLRDDFFPGVSVDPTGGAAPFASAANQDPVVSAIIDRISGLGTQPDAAIVDQAIRKLLNSVAANSASTPDGAGNALKAACAAALGSAAMTVQ